MPPRPCNQLHKPLRLERRRRVTIVAAFSCIDGIMICADTEETTSSESKSESDKLEVFQSANGYVLCGGSGDSSLFELAVHRLQQDMSVHAYRSNEIEAVLNRHASQIFDKHIKCYRGFPSEWIPELFILIAVQVEGQARLYKWEKNFVLSITDGHHDAIGTGFIQALPLLREHRFAMNLYSRQMFFFAVRIIQRVKRQVQGCGGNTDVFVLHHNGERTRYTSSLVDTIEQFADRVDAFSLQTLMTLITSPAAAEQEVDRALDECSTEFKKFRREYVSEIYPMVTHVKSFTVGAFLQESADKASLQVQVRPSIPEKSEPGQ